MVSKSCLLEPACFVIYRILEDAHLQNLSFLKGPSTEFIFFSTFLTLPHISGSLRIKIRNFLFFENYFQRKAIVIWISKIDVQGGEF